MDFKSFIKTFLSVRGLSDKISFHIL